MIVESYGGKRRGHHIYGKFKKDMDAQHVKEVIARVKESEQLKIPFLIKEAFHILQSKKRSLVSKVSIHWGLGCDAVGNNLKEGEPSFLVCQPVNMKAVDTSRKGSASKVFRREEDIPDDPVTQDPPALTLCLATLLQLQRTLTFTLILQIILTLGFLKEGSPSFK